MFKSRHHTGTKNLVANFEHNQVLRNMGTRPLRTVASSKLGKRGYSFHIYPKAGLIYGVETKTWTGPKFEAGNAFATPVLFSVFVPRRWNLEYIPSIGVATKRNGQSSSATWQIQLTLLPYQNWCVVLLVPLLVSSTGNWHSSWVGNGPSRWVA